MRLFTPALLTLALSTAVTQARAGDAEPATPHEPAETRQAVREGEPNRLLLASGAATFAFGYAGAAWVGATSSLSSDRALLVPFAGPWIALAARPACDGSSSGVCGHETTYDGLLIADGLVQFAGVAQIAVAFFRRELRAVEEPVVHASVSRFTRVFRVFRVTPARAAGGGLAIAASGTF